jgi:hypothetical protein
LRDVRIALRVFFLNRSLTLVAIVEFGLGIGTNASVYSTLRAIVLHPVPFKEVDRVLTIGEIVPRPGWEGTIPSLLCGTSNSRPHLFFAKSPGWIDAGDSEGRDDGGEKSYGGDCEDHD